MKRPAEFDAKVIAYMPMLKREAAKYAGPRRDELLQDSLLYIFEKWRNFRGDFNQPNSGFASWLRWQMRSVKSTYAQPKFRTEVQDIDGAIAGNIAVPAQQENITFANQTCRHLSKTREGRMLMRIGTGELLREVGKRRGVTANRVQQLVERARASLPVAA